MILLCYGSWTDRTFDLCMQHRDVDCAMKTWILALMLVRYDPAHYLYITYRDSSTVKPRRYHVPVRSDH